jgi:hypothetical protein
MAKRQVGRDCGGGRDRDQDASFSIPALSEPNPSHAVPKSDIRHAHFSKVYIVLYLSGKS